MQFWFCRLPCGSLLCPQSGKLTWSQAQTSESKGPLSPNAVRNCQKSLSDRCLLEVILEMQRLPSLQDINDINAEFLEKQKPTKITKSPLRKLVLTSVGSWGPGVCSSQHSPPWTSGCCMAGMMAPHVASLPGTAWWSSLFSRKV